MDINFLPYTFLNADGYGRSCSRLIRALTADGISVTPLSREQLGWDGWLQRLAGVDFSRVTLAMMSAGDFPSLPGRMFGYTMYECTAIPDWWAARINDTCEHLIVPHEWMVDVFYNGGVKKTLPIHVVGLGIDPDEFPVIERRGAKRPYTFLALGDRGMRKGHGLVWQAFYKAFGDNPNVRLLIKARRDSLKEWDLSNSDRRLSLWRDDIAHMADVYAQADCFVFPSYAEGWGLPPREAAATGMPVIATNWSGLQAGIEQWAIPIEKYTLKPSLILKNGLWAEADVDELAAHMRWCYDHPDDARAKGASAAAWLRANQTWQHAARDLIALFQKIV